MSDWITKAEDAEVDRIMKLSHAELVAEIEARGEDPADVLEHVNHIIDSAKAEAYRRQRFGHR